MKGLIHVTLKSDVLDPQEGSGQDGDGGQRQGEGCERAVVGRFRQRAEG